MKINTNLINRRKQLVLTCLNTAIQQLVEARGALMVQGTLVGDSDFIDGGANSEQLCADLFLAHMNDASDLTESAVHLHINLMGVIRAQAKEVAEESRTASAEPKAGEGEGGADEGEGGSGDANPATLVLPASMYRTPEAVPADNKWEGCDPTLYPAGSVVGGKVVGS